MALIIAYHRNYLFLWYATQWYTYSESSIPKLWVDREKHCTGYWLRSVCDAGKENVFVKVWEEDKEKGKQTFVTYAGACMMIKEVKGVYLKVWKHHKSSFYVCGNFSCCWLWFIREKHNFFEKIYTLVLTVIIVVKTLSMTWSIFWFRIEVTKRRNVVTPRTCLKAWIYTLYLALRKRGKTFI